jgi:chromosome segregation ATPase
MAAIADRAAHARQVVAEEVGAVAFEHLGALAATLAEAELTLSAARSGRARAEQSAQEATASLADLQAQRLRLAAQVDALTAEAAAAADSPVPGARPSGGGL